MTNTSLKKTANPCPSNDDPGVEPEEAAPWGNRRIRDGEDEEN